MGSLADMLPFLFGFPTMIMDWIQQEQGQNRIDRQTAEAMGLIQDELGNLQFGPQWGQLGLANLPFTYGGRSLQPNSQFSGEGAQLGAPVGMESMEPAFLQNLRDMASSGWSPEDIKSWTGVEVNEQGNPLGTTTPIPIPGGGGEGGQDGQDWSLESLFAPGQSLEDIYREAYPEAGEVTPGSLNIENFNMDPNRLYGFDADSWLGQFDKEAVADIGKDVAGYLEGTSAGVGGGIAAAQQQAQSTAAGALLGAQRATQGAWLEPGTLFERAGGGVPFDAEAQRGARLGQLGELERQQVSQAQSQDLSRELGAGRSLEDAQSSLRRTTRGIEGQIGRTGAQIESDIDTQALQHALSQQSLRGTLAGTESGINANLASTLANIAGQLGGQQMSTQAGLATTGANIGADLGSQAANLIAQTGLSGAQLWQSMLTQFGGLEASNLGTLASVDASNLNAQLAASLGVRQQDIQTAFGNLSEMRERGVDLAQFANQDWMQNFQGDQASWDAMMGYGGMQQQLMSQILGMRAGLVGQGADMTANTPTIIPQFGPAMDQMLSMWLAGGVGGDIPGPKPSGGLTLFGFGASGGCIDGACRVPTPNGLRRLRDIEVGDEVYGADGEVRGVVRKDYGTVPPERQHDHVAIHTSSGTIRATRDHVIGGRAADEWKTDDEMPMMRGTATVLAVEPCAYVWSGDLELEDNADYIADGFVVSSQIAAISAAA